MDERVIKLPTVMQLTGMSRSLTYQKIREGVFPAPIKLVEGGRAVGWLASDVANYIEQRAALRGGVK